MLLARVVGSVWGARQAEGLAGNRLLRVEPLMALGLDDGPSPEAGTRDSAPSISGGPASNRPVEWLDIDADHVPLRSNPRQVKVVLDRLGAGPGELVLVAHGSRCRDLAFGPEGQTLPVKELVVAIVDQARIGLTSGSTVGGQP